MNELTMVVGIAALFLLRIGVPVIILVGLGILLDYWQSHRDRSM